MNSGNFSKRTNYSFIGVFIIGLVMIFFYRIGLVNSFDNIVLTGLLDHMVNKLYRFKCLLIFGYTHILFMIDVKAVIIFSSVAEV